MKLLLLRYIATILLLCLNAIAIGQEVPFLNFAINEFEQVSIEVASTPNHYYILKVRHNPGADFTESTSMTIGQEGTTIISEPLHNYPESHYKILEYSINNPNDTDIDGLDDISEFNNTPLQSPINSATEMAIINGLTNLTNLGVYNEMSVEGVEIPWAPFLDNREFVKFGIIDVLSEKPKIYFINTNTHPLHWQFYDAIGINISQEDHVNGEIIYYPNVIAENGNTGVFSFAYSQGLGKPFEVIQRTNEVLAANMPFLKNNLTYLITENSEEDYYEEQEAFDNSRVKILQENEIYADLEYLALHESQGFGLLRVMDLEETPGARDIVIYEAIPNNLPRVGGIISSFTQTPLSHVNLRAIRDNIPNSYIKNPLDIEELQLLVDRYVYYKVTQEQYFIREATLEEVNAWHESLRPQEEQHPPLNLSYESIIPLDDITFDMSDGFGAKCANVATMRTFGFPDQTIPNGYGIPFYFYQEFMKFNGFFNQIALMIQNPDFINDLDTRLAMLDTLRDDIKNGEMPQWMLDRLQSMHGSFPPGTSIRCRSSTNNEDLPGFSGAGLYSSKTQHPDEGHISKSIKQVYASMWNFRAFDARDYYRVNHFEASMGILCHPNFSDEKANGVGISTDPIFNTENTFYLNTQAGEDLITNPEAQSIPEELLLNKMEQSENDYTIIRYSNQVPNGVLLLNKNYRNQLREYLTTIHDEFAILYDAVGNDTFAVDIEYKITSDNYLSIKQARPWASFWAEVNPRVVLRPSEILIVPNPATIETTVYCDCAATSIRIVNLLGQIILEQPADFENLQSTILIDALSRGLYIIDGLSDENEIVFSKKLLVN